MFFFLKRTGRTGARSARVPGRAGKDPPGLPRRGEGVEGPGGAASKGQFPPRAVRFCRQVVLIMDSSVDAGLRSAVRHFLATLFRVDLQAGNPGDGRLCECRSGEIGFEVAHGRHGILVAHDALDG